MPSLDLPVDLTKPMKIQVSHIHYDRMGPDSSGPLVRMVIASGYYATDADGNPILNAIGFPKFIPVSVLTEFHIPLADPGAQTVIGAREIEYRTRLLEHITTNNPIPILAVWDDYQTQLCLDLYASRYLGQTVGPE